MPQRSSNWKSGFFITDMSLLWFAWINLHTWNCVIHVPTCENLNVHLQRTHEWIGQIWGESGWPLREIKNYTCLPQRYLQGELHSFPPFEKSGEPERAQGTALLHSTATLTAYNFIRATAVSRHESLKQEVKKKKTNIGQVCKFLPLGKKTEDRKPQEAEYK